MGGGSVGAAEEPGSEEHDEGEEWRMESGGGGHAASEAVKEGAGEAGGD